MPSRRANRPGRKVMHPARRFLARNTLPAVAVAAAVLVSRLLGHISYTLFFAIVLLSAWYGGLGPALTAVVLSLLAVHSVFVPHMSDLDLGVSLLSRSVRFVLMSGLLIWLNESRRWAVVALRESEQRLRTFVDHAADAFFLHDERGAVLDVNRQACEALGYTRDELLGMTATDFDPDVTPVDIEDIERRLEPGDPIAFESRHRRKDGTVFPVEVRGQAFWESDRRLTVSLARDITDRKRAEQELRQARDELESKVAERTAELLRATGELQTTLDASPVGIALFGGDQTVRRCNPAFERIMGWAADEIAGRPISLLHANHEEWIALTEKLNRGEVFANVETRLFRNDGSEFDAALSCAPLQAEAGSPAGFVAAVEDISDRKRADQALRRSEAYLAEAQRVSHTGSWAWDPVIRETTHWSEEQSRLFGFDPEAGVPSFEEHIRSYHPEDRERVLETLDRAVRERTDLEVDFRTVLPDGTIKYIHGVGHPVFNASGDLVEFVGTAMDVTERRRADEERERLLAGDRAARAEAVAAQHRFRDLVNSVEGIVWEADAETFAFSFVNEQAERILGYPIERWLNEPTFWKDHLHPDDRDWAIDFCSKATAEKRNHDFEYRMIAADGRIVWLRDLVTVVVEGDRATKLRGVMVDIAERKRAEVERQAHLWFFESMDRVNRAIQGTNDLEQMMSDVLDTVLSIFECDRAWLVHPCDPEATSWQVPMEHSRPEFPGLFALGLDVPADPEVVELFRTVRASNGPVRLGPGSEYPLPAEVSERFRIQSQIVMAIYPKVDKPYMFGLHQCSYPRAWTPQEERLFQEIGRRLADGLTSLLMFRNLRDSEARLEQAQRIAHLGHWDRDLDTDRLTLSDETCRIFGLTPQEGTFDRAGFEELIHPEDRPMNDRARAEALRGGLRYDVECRAVRPGGEVRILHSQGDVMRDASGRPRRIFGTVQDITERKRAEQALRENQQLLQAIFDNSNVGIHVKDLEGRYLLVNRRFEEAVGRRGDEILGKTDLDIFPEESARRQQEFDRKVLEAGAALETEEVDVLQGGPRWVLKIECPLFDPSGEPYATCGISTDITERRAKEAAEAANRAKDEFLANVSHEIRTPMNAILGMTELVLDTPLTGDQRQCLRTVKSAADSLLGLMNDLLDFSKIEAGKLELEPADFVLRAAIGDTLRALAVRAHRKGLELIYDVQPEVPDALVGDAGRLRQVLLNLVSNAIKFTDAGEVVVRVEIASDPPLEAEVGLRFTVRDTGIGIPQDQQERIFRAFEQEDTSTTRKYGGTGLGLTIAVRLVALMRGQITVESEPGRGSTFSFTAGFGRQPHPPEQVPLRPPVLLQGLPVLVVDDNATNRHILEEWLRGWQMEPAAVGDGLAALDALWDAVSVGRPYTLVLLDARMPDTDGLALAAKIRKRTELAATRIILLTSGERPGDWDRVREQRIDAHLLKPVPQDELLETIYRVMSRANGDAPPTVGSVGGREPVAAPIPAAAPLRILVAEDNEINAQLLEKLLARRGHRVRLTNNGREALALAGEGAFDLLLLDVHMPELDGFQVIQAVRERERSTGGHLPVIALTARARQEDRVRCLAAGMDDFLAKPIQAADLWAATERVTGSRPPANRQGPGLLDPRVVLAACGGDAATLEKICQVLRDRLPDHLRAVQDALRDRDAVRLREASHKLYGTVAAFSTVAGAVASDLEDQAARGQLEEARPLVEQLGAIARELIQQVDGLSIETLRDQAGAAGDRDRTAIP
jgi:two-component system sensor histidine kinase/response regulator